MYVANTTYAYAVMRDGNPFGAGPFGYDTGDWFKVIARALDENMEKELKTLKFNSYSEDWLNFILNCRSEKDLTDYDLVIGGVANDKVFNTVELFFDGLIDKTEAIKRLRYEKPNLQICFRTEKALEYLSFEGSERV